MPSGRVARGVKPASLLSPKTPLVRLRWKVENPDEDELSYRVYIRALFEPPAAGPAPAPPPTLGGEADGEWLRLSGPDPLPRAELDWNTDTVGDGLYELKVVVSDERSNPPELAQSHELISAPFIVDNRKPELREVKWNAAAHMVTGLAVDAVSPIAELRLFFSTAETSSRWRRATAYSMKRAKSSSSGRHGLRPAPTCYLCGPAMPRTTWAPSSWLSTPNRRHAVIY